MEQYLWNEKSNIDEISIIENGIIVNFNRADFSRATWNYGGLVLCHIDQGLLHWRHGLDPRPDFESGILAYEKMRTVARDHAVPKDVAQIPLVYAMLSLMGCHTSIEFENEAYHEEHRWPCYECCLVHVLHDQLLNENHTRLLDKYLAENRGFPDDVFLTYFQLLGLRPSDLSSDDLVRVAEVNWVKRRGAKFFAGGSSRDGHGVMNDLYVDLYLSAVLKKIGWKGESIHRWKWD